MSQIIPRQTQAPSVPSAWELWELSEPNFLIAAATAAKMAVFATALAPDLEHAPEPPGGLLKIQVAGLHSVVWDAAVPRRAQHSVSQKFPGDADVTCRGSLFENHCFKSLNNPSSC